MVPAILTDYSYVTPERMIAACVLFPLLGVVIVALRFYSRLVHKLGLRSDDWFIFISMITNVGLGIAFTIGVVDQAIGYPTPRIHSLASGEVPKYPPQLTLVLQMEYVMFCLQTLTLAFAKLSVVMFYRRIFCVGAGNTWFDYTSISMVVICGLWGVGFFLSTAFNCGTHFSSYWQPGEPGCLPYVSRPMGFVISDFLTDFIILCMPIGMVWRLRLSARRKVIVTAFFLFGALAILASLVRMVVFVITVTAKAKSTNVDTDLFFSVLFFWTIVESSLCIIAACLPLIRLFPGKSSLTCGLRSRLSSQPLSSYASRPTLKKNSSSFVEMTSGDKMNEQSTFRDRLETESWVEDNAKDRSPISEKRPVNGIYLV